MTRAEKAVLMEIVQHLKATQPMFILCSCDALAAKVAHAAWARGLPAYRVDGEAEWNHPGEGWYHDGHTWVVIHHGDPAAAHASRNVFDPKLEVFRARWRKRGIKPYRRYRGEAAYPGHMEQP